MYKSWELFHSGFCNNSLLVISSNICGGFKTHRFCKHINWIWPTFFFRELSYVRKLSFSLKILLIMELLFKSLGIYAAFKVFSLLSISIIASPHLKYYVLVYYVLFVLFQMKLKKRRYVFKIYFSFGKQYCCSIYHFRNSLMFF